MIANSEEAQETPRREALKMRRNTLDTVLDMIGKSFMKMFFRLGTVLGVLSLFICIVYVFNLEVGTLIRACYLVCSAVGFIIVFFIIDIIRIVLIHGIVRAFRNYFEFHKKIKEREVRRKAMRKHAKTSGWGR